MADRSANGAAVALAGAVGLFLVWPGGAFGQNSSPESPSPVRKVDLYLSGHLFGLFPQDKDLSVGGNRMPDTDVRGTIGAGGGTSMGVLYNTSIQSGSSTLAGSSGEVAFAYQFLGGVKTFVTKCLFLSGESKYFGTKYSWNSEGSGDSNVKLDFRTHIISGGLGWSF